MKLYDQLSDWYTLLTPLADYTEEAPTYRAALVGALGPGRHTLLELGAGAGHNAHYIAADFDLTLTDLSPQMLALARVSCPDATCVVGDMRSLRLGRTFDAVFAHDALCYMMTEADLAAVFATARAHLAPGGVSCWRRTTSRRPTRRGRTRAGATATGARCASWRGCGSARASATVTWWTTRS